jgi:hypothetical protein
MMVEGLPEKDLDTRKPHKYSGKPPKHFIAYCTTTIYPAVLMFSAFNRD